jgi:hypothetical protein
MIRPGACWAYLSSSYTDYSDNVKINAPITFITSSAQSFYIGADHRYTGLYSDLSTNGIYTGIKYEYLNSFGEWKKLSLIDNYVFSISKYQRWLLPDKDWIKTNFTSSFPETGAPPDAYERYWIKITCTVVTIPAVISKLRLIPYAQYASPELVSDFLQLPETFSNSTKPTDLIVEDLIVRAEARIDNVTYKSWRFNAVTEATDPRMVDFNRFGMFLRNRNFYKVYSVQMWNGSTYTTLSEGRDADYQVDYNLGIIYMTRQFLMPAIFGMMGRAGQYNFGEYKNAVTVDYLSGRDSETDRDFSIVEELAIKMVARDLLNHHDYSSFIASGSDKVQLSEKIANLSQEISDQLEELKGVTLF